MTTSAACEKPAPRATGYSVLRAGRLPDMNVCLALPHISAPVSATFDPVGRRLELDLGPARLLLPELPADVVALMKRAPERVLVVTVGSLTQARSSVKLNDLIRTTH